MANQVRVYERSCLETSVANLSSRWNSVTEYKGYYLEGIKKGKPYNIYSSEVIRQLALFTELTSYITGN